MRIAVRNVVLVAAVAALVVPVLAAGSVRDRGGKHASTPVEAGAPPSVVLAGQLSGPGEGSERSARAYLTGAAAELELDPSLDGLVLDRMFSTPMGSHVVFRQEVGGIQVLGAEVAVHFDLDGVVVTTSSSYVRGLATVQSPRLGRDGAREALRRSLPALSASSAPPAGVDDEAADEGLRLLAGPSGARLVWEVSRARMDGTWRALVDAGTGLLLGAPVDVNRYVNGTGRVFRDNAVVATRTPTLADHGDAASAVPAGAYSTVALPGLNGSGKLDGQFASSSASRRRVTSATNTFSFDRSMDGFSETMGYYWLDYAQRTIQSLGFTNVVNRQQVFSVDRIADDNSFYSPATRQITLGKGGVDDAEDAEVVLHEYGHAIQDNQRPGFGIGAQAGAMGEGFGDYWAASVTARVSGGYLDTCFAEWDGVVWPTAVPHCLRRLDGTKHYPESLAGEVHDDGEIWSAALWQIRGALGAAAADRVILQHHFLLAAAATFNQAANALVTSAIGLRLSSTAVGSIRTILRNRGFTVTT